MSRATMVHVQDPRVAWSVPAADVVRIVSVDDWRAAAPPIDVLAALGPVPHVDLLSRRVVVVRGVRDRETALVAGGPVKIQDVELSALLSLPSLFAAAMPEVAAVVVSPDASMSLVLRPSAVADRADAARP
jgi:hypothetical protein